MKDRLCVVMPVYNEEGAIGSVLCKWSRMLDGLGIDYEIRPYNDGSKDRSLEVMRDVAHRIGHGISVRDKPNGGHGNTILTGYREAAADGYDWVFQIDSDDEMGPEQFGELWARRDDHDFLVGIRDGRVQALPRMIVSFVSRLCVRVFYGSGVWDVNTPYRLMRVSAFKDFYDRIPLSTFAPNVILSGLAARHRLRCFEMPVPQHDRTTGEVSIKKWKLLKAATRSFGQTIAFAFKSARGRDWRRFLCWGGAWAFAAVSIAVGVKNGFREFDFQWDPAKLLMMGDNPYMYSLEQKAVPYECFMEKYVAANQVPSCLLLLAPFTFLPQLLANQVWDVCNLIFSGVFLLFLYRLFFANARGFPFVALLFLACTPLRILIGNGQHLMFSLAFFMPALFFASKGRHSLSGVLLALSMFKYTTIVPLAFIFILKQRWKPVVIAAGLHILATIGCGIWLRESPISLVLQSLKVGAAQTGFGLCDLGSMAIAMGSANAFLWANIGYALWGIILVWLTFVRGKDLLLMLSVFACISNVMFYHRTYDLVTMVFPLSYIVLNWRAKGEWLTSLRIITGLNVAYIFFGSTVLDILGISVDEVGICFVLQHALLASLLIHMMFSSPELPHSNKDSHNSMPMLM